MCLMCEQEDLYFLYLERVEQARRAARGEGAPANANWLWPAVTTGASPAAAHVLAKPVPDADRAWVPVRRQEHAALNESRPDVKSSFVCDAPDK
jgi:hypothetical protein